LLRTNERQFGFKNDSSTHFAFLTVKEVVQYYTKNGSNVHVSFLDISKAFDKVSHHKLFKTLRLNGFDEQMISLVSNWYCRQKIKVKYNNVFSDSWYLRNGVRQGGIMSPYFFILYIDAVIDKISKLKYGCKIKFINVNNVAFADDIVILAPTAFALQNILNVLNIELEQINLFLNPAKCAYMIINKSRKIKETSANIHINNIKLKYVDQYKYLGFIINNRLSNKHDIIRARNKFYAVFNMLLRRFHYVNSEIFLTLFKSYCVQFYGAELWFDNKNCMVELKRFSVGYHKAIKKIFRIPYYYSNHYVCNKLQLFTFSHFLNWIKIRFAYNVLNSRNILLIKLKDFYWHESSFVSSVKKLMWSEYNIIDIDNDLDAIRSRISFVQQREAHSNAFDFLNNNTLDLELSL
jgi:hypothetical protein